MGIFKTDGDVHTLPAKQLLKDVWWALRSTSEGGRATLEAWVPRLGPDWKAVPGQHTTLETEVGALPQNFAVLRGELAAVRETLAQVAKGQGVALDPEAIKAAARDGAAEALESLRIVSLDVAK